MPMSNMSGRAQLAQQAQQAQGSPQSQPQDPNAQFPLPELPSSKGFSESGPIQILRTDAGAGRPQLTIGSPDYTVQGGQAGFQKEVDNYFIIRQRRLDNLLANLDDKTAQAVRDDVAANLATLQSGGIATQQGTIPWASATPDQQLAARDAIYAQAEKAAIQSGGVKPKAQSGSADSTTTSLGYTPQDLAALQAVASKYLLPFVQQAAASGGMAQATMNQIASQAATPQMRLYATAMGNAQKAGQDQIAAAYMQQVSAAPTMQVIAANTDLAQQNAQLQQQLLYYKTMQQQGQSAPSTDLFAQAQAAMSGAGTGG